MTDSVDAITPAALIWQKDALGNVVPASATFGDVYYSLEDGMAESRYVFVEQNHLPSRFAALFAQAYDVSRLDGHQTSHNLTFTILELGFGTGLNLLTTWQLWQQVKAQTQQTQQEQAQQTQSNLPHATRAYRKPHLHIISTEKYPLTYEDIKRSLSIWRQRDASLRPLIDSLLKLYPTLVAGCHRLHLDEDVTLDLWLGDAADSLSKLDNRHGAGIDAWYLDGFAPSCNESLWAAHIFMQMRRLSSLGSTAATFSCAGVVKRGLTQAGFDIQKVKGFGRKRHMLTAVFAADLSSHTDNSIYDRTHVRRNRNFDNGQRIQPCHEYPNHVAVIGAGVSGLMCAWAFANRGIQVTLLDKAAPLAGASGNPRALLAPKMTPLAHVAEHLHSISYLYSQRLYRQLGEHTGSILEPTAAIDLLLKANVDKSQIEDYPDTMAQVLSAQKAQELTGLTSQIRTDTLYLPQAGLVNPQALANRVLSHPDIHFVQAEVNRITTSLPPHFSLPKSSEESSERSSEESSADLTPPPKAALLTLSKSSCRTGLSHEVSNDTDASDTDARSPDPTTLSADAVIICAGFESHKLNTTIFDFRKIRGQLSWFIPSPTQLNALPKMPLKYGGYCALFTPKPQDSKLNQVTPHQPTFLLGASFVRNYISQESRDSEHLINQGKLITAVPELAEVISVSADTDDRSGDNGRGDNGKWYARVGIRAQTPDYHPVVGQIDTEGLIWTMSGMGSKGYAFAPLCAEVLADRMTHRFSPVSDRMLARLSPKRARLQQPL